ncbi:MAG: hypothetical protein C4527_27760 [Candidatus Omnitrophota bacterium]|nr:MAG: hypothetical protein C4527_27760 [Candidatus Omnitrophota bacterium]
MVFLFLQMIVQRFSSQQNVITHYHAVLLIILSVDVMRITPPGAKESKSGLARWGGINFHTGFVLETTAVLF